jgi:hypothetical protein
MRRLTSWLIVSLVVGFCCTARAGGPCSGVKGGCHRSTYRDSARTTAPSTRSVHVDGYHRKDGTYVRTYERRPQGTAHDTDDSAAGLPSSPPDEKPTQKYRTSARTNARSSVWKGTGSAPDNDAKAPAAKPLLLAKYVVYPKNGRKFEIADYRDDKTSYWLTLLNGGGMRYEKSTVAKIEPITNDTPAPD